MFCERCGVELEDDLSACPLCGSGSLVDEEPRVAAYHRDQPPEPVSVVRTAASRSIAAVAATAAVILLIVDVGLNAGLTWSPVPLVSVLGGAALVLILLRGGFRLPGAGAALAALLAMLAAIDLAANAVLEWFVPVAVPIVITAGLLLAVGIRLVPRLRGVVKAAAVLAALGLLTTVIDLAIQRYLGRPGELGWSLVVLVSTLPIAVLFVVLDRTVLRYVDLYRRFHV